MDEEKARACAFPGFVEYDQKIGFPESSLMSFFQTVSICFTTLSGIGM
jgi:hypothetical protein